MVRPRLGLTFALVLLTCGPSAAQQVDSIYRFRTLPTEHFLIYFHQGEDRLAARLAVIAEDTWHALAQPLGTTPPRLTHVILVDQTESANGWATALPRDTIAIYAVWPAGSDLLKTDDWLRLAFTHEFTHIVHLDRSKGWARIARGVFGRTPVAFPNEFLPLWQIEGLAVFEESRITGEGRLSDPDFRAIVDEAARARRLEPLDRVNGGLTDWPGGSAHYAYGLGFHAYLADRFGADRLATLADATARRLPYTGSRAFKQVYGKTLGTLWREYETSLAASTATSGIDDHARQLTTHHFAVAGPRFASPGCAGCGPEILYSVQTADDFPALYRLRLDGSAPARLTTRYLGTTTAPGRETIYFDQAEVRRNTGVYNDLYALDRASGRVRRVTEGARLVDPDLAPDGRTIAAVRNTAGERDLVLVRLPGSGASTAADITTLIGEADTQFNAPRWSPDGRAIAVERQRLGAQPEIVIVEVATGAVRVVASDPVARWVTPAWRPDGLAIVAAADLDGHVFNVYEVDLAASKIRQLTHTTGGATSPDVAPDGQSIVYVGYTVDGFELFQLPYVHVSGGEPQRAAPPAAPGRSPTRPAPATVDVSRASPYSPWPTLAPTSWSPDGDVSNQQVRAGAAVNGADVLGYHAYTASATWGISHPAGAPSVGAAPDWHLTYAYLRWRPIVFASASRETSFFGGPPTATGVPSTSAVRERKIEIGVEVPVNHVRVAQGVLGSIVRAVDDFTFANGAVSQPRAAARAAWWIASAHGYGNSISFEGGVEIGATAELVRRALGSAADATTMAGDVRAYLPGLGAHHVLAVRVSGGRTTGDPVLGRTFLLGGAASNPSPVDFGSEAISLLRGFPADSFAGTHVALVNLDYRFPLLKIERGKGTWPLFLHTIHAAIFADAGHAWTTRFNARDLKTSIGAELSLKMVAGYWLPLTATAGAAWGHDGSHAVADGMTSYVRVGYAF